MMMPKRSHDRGTQIRGRYSVNNDDLPSIDSTRIETTGTQKWCAVMSSNYFSYHLLWNRDLCEYMTTNSHLIEAEPNVRRVRRVRLPSTSTDSPTLEVQPPLENQSNLTTPTIANPHRPFHQNVWQLMKSVHDLVVGHQMESRVAVMGNVPDNSVSNLVKMILLPIMLVIIGVMMVPLIRELATQTFTSIFYNNKLPENRHATLKRVSVGVSLIFDHMIKKIFPIVKLRWLNNELFRRRDHAGTSIPVPPANPQ